MYDLFVCILTLFMYHILKLTDNPYGDYSEFFIT